MIDFIFTIDYEIYGNGTGSLRELVYDPAARLKEVFQKHRARFVNFVEVLEFEKIEAYGTDPAIDLVRQQVQGFFRDDFEIALHLHPQWANACYEDQHWQLDFNEYNLCRLSENRIATIVDGSLAYLSDMVGQAGYTPLSFRAGNWLFQPTQTAAGVLAARGLRIDSSVFKGGVQHNHKLDYRNAAKNGYYWPFSRDVNRPDPIGQWIEIPIHSNMVPFWRMATSKRTAFSNQFGGARRSKKQTVGRALDFMRLFYPLKLDFCRMTLQELTSMVNHVLAEDRKEPGTYRPIVAIGHTKDLTDFDTVDSFLTFLKTHQIRVATFRDVYSRLRASIGWPEQDGLSPNWTVSPATAKD